MDKMLFRGQIYYADLPDTQKFVQSGKRPVIIVSNNIGNQHSNIVLVVPITSQNKRNLPTHFEIILPNIFGTVLCEQIRAVNKESIGDYAGCLTSHYIKLLDGALIAALNIDGKIGEALPPEESRVIQQQFERVETIRLRYLKEIKILQNMVGYRKTPEERLVQNSGVSSSPDLPKKRTYKKRTAEEIKEFIQEWENPRSVKEDVASVFGFSSKVTAQTFYRRHKGI